MTDSIPSDINLSDNDESMADLIEMVQQTEKKLSDLEENYVPTVAVRKVLLEYGIDPNIARCTSSKLAQVCPSDITTS